LFRALQKTNLQSLVAAFEIALCSDSLAGCLLTDRSYGAVKRDHQAWSLNRIQAVFLMGGIAQNPIFIENCGNLTSSKKTFCYSCPAWIYATQIELCEAPMLCA